MTNRVHKFPISLHTELVKMQLQQLIDGGRAEWQNMATLCLALINLGMVLSKGEKPSPHLLDDEQKVSGGLTVSVAILSDETTQYKLKLIAKNGRQLSQTAMCLIIVALKK